MGLKYDYVTGYNNSSDARLAVQRNEAQYHDETLPGYRTQVEPQMVKTGMVIPLYYTDLVAPSGEILVSRDVPELLPFSYFYRELFGKPPAGIKYEALKAANMSSTNMTRMVLLPPKVPAGIDRNPAQSLRRFVEGSGFPPGRDRGHALPAAFRSRRGRRALVQTGVTSVSRSCQFPAHVHRRGE